MAAQSNDWPLLSEALDWLGTIAIEAASNIIGRGQVPVTAIRSDIPGSTTAEPIGALLTKAKETRVWYLSNEIIATFDKGQDRRSILGERSNLEDAYGGLVWSYGPTDWHIRFRNVRVQWSCLVKALAAAGFRVRQARTRPGPKENESGKGLACDIALRVLDDETRRPNLGYGRVMTIARAANIELARCGHHYEVDSVRKMIGPSVREWEKEHPGK
jgi:hypothetical protein